MESHTKAALDVLDSAINGADREEASRLLGELERLKAILWGRVMMLPEQRPSPVSDLGSYLTVEEVAERFHVTPKWLYRHKTTMPHSQPSRKILLFPEGAITKWFASRKGS